MPPPKNTVRAGRSGPATRAPAGELDLAQQGVGVLVLARAAQFARGVGVEVAIAAADPAERDVQVDAERGVSSIRRPAASRRPVTGSPSGSAEPISASRGGRVQR